MNKIQIIGVAGTNGAGKDAIGNILAEKYGYLFVSVTDLLRDEARHRGLPVERGVLRTISAEWRRELGLGVLVDKAIVEYDIAKDKYKGVVIASIRNPGEADRIHRLHGTMLWVDADPEIRYERVQASAASRNRAGEDNKTFEQFQAEEAAEMHTTGDAATLDLAAVRDLCDISIINDSPDLETLETNLKKALEL